jgi:hypothetical protein
MYDQAGKQLVWSGKSTKTIDPGKNQEKPEGIGQGYGKVVEGFSAQTVGRVTMPATSTQKHEERNKSWLQNNRIS